MNFLVSDLFQLWVVSTHSYVTLCGSISQLSPGLKALDVAVRLQAGEEDVEKPQAEEEQGGQQSGHPGTTQLSTNGWSTSEQKNSHGDESKDGEKCDGEGQRAGVNFKLLPLELPVDRSHRPSQADAQEHVDSVAASDVTNGGVSVLVLYGSHFASKRVWAKGKKRREQDGIFTHLQQL